LLLPAGVLAGVAAAAGTARSASGQPTSFTVAGNLTGVAATTARDAWAVGSTGSVPQSESLIVHWNGTSWKRVPSPSPAGSTLSGVAVTSASDAWAVGTIYSSTGASQTLILDWNGTVWTQVASPSPGTYNSLSRVTAVSASDAWAVGSTVNGTNEKTLILHWNGTAWTEMPSPSLGTRAVLNGVAATSASNAWAVGLTRKASSSPAKTLILHWNGTAWTRVPSPSPEREGLDDGMIDVGVTSSGGAWATGFFDNCGCGPAPGLIVRWNGRIWRRVAAPRLVSGGADLPGIAIVSARRAWIVGLTGEGDGPTKTLILSWHGAAWKQVPSPSPGASATLSGVAAISHDNAWAVGSSSHQLHGSTTTLILHWNGTAWK
jgi:hypothetical protein